jgi:hypothetical protein
MARSDEQAESPEGLSFSLNDKQIAMERMRMAKTLKIKGGTT